MKCLKCGTEYEGNFCPNCGTKNGAMSRKRKIDMYVVKHWRSLLLSLIFLLVAAGLVTCIVSDALSRQAADAAFWRSATREALAIADDETEESSSSTAASTETEPDKKPKQTSVVKANKETEPNEKTTSKVTKINKETTAERSTDPPVEDRIINNTSAGGFWANGSGDYVASGLKITEYGVLHIEYNGEGNFSVTSYENDDYDGLLVNEIGNYSGDVLIDHSGTFELQIEAEGSWSITSSGLDIDDSTTFSGFGDSVTGITTHDGGNWHITHAGSSNFSVTQYGLNEGYMDLLVNVIGNYDGVVKAEKGDYIFFEINADGNWTISKQ